MGLSDKVKAREAQISGGEATTTNATTPTAPTKPVDAKGGIKKSSAFKESGASLRSQMTEDEKKIEGSKSDKVAFVCALGDPNRKQSRVQGNQNIDSYVVVGYKFKVLEDTNVPFAPIVEGGKDMLDVAPATERPVKAGEVVGLNLVETAMFISKLEYAGKFSGEGNTVIISAKSSQDRKDPLPFLMKQGQGTGSIKENMEFIADMIGADGKNKGTPQIKEEYKDSFGAIYAKRTISKKSAGANNKKGEGQADIAAAFRSYYANKKN